jgi:hypothetical protein
MVAAAIIKRLANWRKKQTGEQRLLASFPYRSVHRPIGANASPHARGGGRLLAAGENARRRGVKAAMALEERRDGNMCGVAAASAMAWLAAWRHGGGAQRHRCARGNAIAPRLHN